MRRGARNGSRRSGSKCILVSDKLLGATALFSALTVTCVIFLSYQRIDQLSGNWNNITIITLPSSQRQSLRLYSNLDGPEWKEIDSRESHAGLDESSELKINMWVNNDGPQKIALLFAPLRDLFNEPVWRAFFEAAGNISFRFVPPDRPYTTFIHGEGKELFDEISNEKTRRKLKNVRRVERTSLCRHESALLEKEVQRLVTRKAKRPNVISNQHLFSVYTHPTAGFYLPEESIFFGTEISVRLNMTNSWGAYRIMEVELNLLEAALKEKQNMKFVLLSEACIPLYRPELIYFQLLSEEKSRTNACGPWHRKDGRHRWNEQMETEHLYKEKWRKSPQWFALKRSHAEIIVEDTHLRDRFRKYCVPNRWPKFCPADEHFIPVMLAVYGLDGQTDCIGNVTKSLRPHGPSPHPLSFRPEAINPKLFNLLRDSERCHYEDTQASTRSVLRDVHGGDRCLRYNTEDLPFAYPEDRDDWIVRSGFIPMAYRCSLFARKFPRESVQYTLRTALKCDGGALGYWC